MPDKTSLGWILILVGFAALGGGWVGVQSTPIVPVQLAYLSSGGLVGIALTVVGSALIRADDARVSREILEELRDRFDDIEIDLAALRSVQDGLGAAPGADTPPHLEVMQ